jgi:hypothetical protein
MRAHKRRYLMPKLADGVVEAMEDRNLSISSFMRQPISSDGETSASDGLSQDVSAQLRGCDQRLKLGTSVEAWRSEWENFIAVLRECHGKLNRDMLCGNDLRSPLLGRHS